MQCLFPFFDSSKIVIITSLSHDLHEVFGALTSGHRESCTVLSYGLVHKGITSAPYTISDNFESDLSANLQLEPEYITGITVFV